MLIRSACDALAAVLFPAPCRICAATLTTASRLPICVQCFASVEPIAKPICVCCGRPFLSHIEMTEQPEQLELGAELQTHGRLCRANFYAFHLARSFKAYNETLQNAILLRKFERFTCLGEWGRRGSSGATASGPPTGAGLQSGGADCTSFGAKTASKTWTIFIDVHDAPTAAVGAFAEGALGFGAWRVRYAEGPAS